MWLNKKTIFVCAIVAGKNLKEFVLHTIDTPSLEYKGLVYKGQYSDFEKNKGHRVLVTFE